MKSLLALLAQVGLVVVTYLAVIGDNQYATNVVYFTVALSVIIATVFVIVPLNVARRASLMLNPRPSAVMIADGCILILLVMGGWWWCVAGHTWQMICMARMHDLRRHTIAALRGEPNESNPRTNA